jgi:hypothetical protein
MNTPEVLEKITLKGERNPIYGTHRSKKTKERISRALIGKSYPKSEEAKLNMKNSWTEERRKCAGLRVVIRFFKRIIHNAEWT